MELWIVASAVIGGFVGYLMGYSNGFERARYRGCELIAFLAMSWGKTDEDVKKSLDAAMEPEC